MRKHHYKVQTILIQINTEPESSCRLINPSGFRFFTVTANFSTNATSRDRAFPLEVWEVAIDLASGQLETEINQMQQYPIFIITSNDLRHQKSEEKENVSCSMLRTSTVKLIGRLNGRVAPRELTIKSPRENRHASFKTSSSICVYSSPSGAQSSLCSSDIG